MACFQAFLALVGCFLAALYKLAPSETHFRFLDSLDLARHQLLEHPFPFVFPRLQNGTWSNRGQFPMPLCHGFTLEEATIDKIQMALSDGTFTSVQLVMCYLQRIHQMDKYISATMELNPDILDVASQLDHERARGNIFGPLHGIPFLVKDNMATKDKMETTAGSWMLLGSVVPRDAHVVWKLRKAGAILIGHSNMGEFADMRSSSHSPGYSVRGGQTRNPYNLTTSPGSSSSGSAAAVAANLVTFALGTETDGSVTMPAYRNSLVGVKPTVGLTSRAGIIPESHNQDSTGCLSRTVKDGVYCLDAIYGPDTRDNYTLIQKAPVGGFPQYVSDQYALKGAKFGLPWLSFWQYANVNQQQWLLELINLIKAAGAKIINGTELPHWQTTVSPDGWDWDYGNTRGYPNESEYTYVKVDFYNDIAKYLSELDNTDIRTLKDIVNNNLENGASQGSQPGVHPAFPSGQDSFLASLETKGIMDETYWQALEFCHRTTREEGIDAALHNNGQEVSALLVPPDTGLPGQIAAQAGYPMIILPAGMDEDSGIPFGLGLMGTAWSESVLIKYASAIEDLQLSSGTRLKRQLPDWRDYRSRIIPDH